MQTHAADEFPKLNVFDQTLNDEFLTKRVFEVLTNKEIEVFALAYKGHLNKNIAVELKSSIRTIDIHRYRIKKKLKLNSQSEIAVLGYRVQKALVNFLPRKRVDLLSIDNV